MSTVHANGAETYHEIHGDGEPVLLLHGGFCSLEVMRPQLNSLSRRFRVHAPERPGHGRTADAEGPMSYAKNVADTLAYMDEVGLRDAHVVGFSDGAIIGLLMALDHPDRIRSLVAVSVNLHPSGFVGENSDNWPGDNSDPADHYREHHARLSPDGPDRAQTVLDKLQHLWTTEPDIDPARLAEVRIPALIMAGDRDVIRADHTRTIATSLPRGQMCIVPGAGHDVLETRPELANMVIEQFISDISGTRAAD
ncbi:alpha/beta fold hydrolase [Rhodococcoides kyotonense]|uniref:Pimeloyl-ACP methyl ester carboxylesterase n=1 Tax=Rhodococcoides kyotonense TaxID=398843 RepID=A0A239L6H2_9NOCA|nr:alpha/beta hydrolase [Rhodococcus kyotonensis]SNT25518.1 Pimeloyl-ACP methyl ester carboxylesterase [Rhodococcus kyotonensis]